MTTDRRLLARFHGPIPFHDADWSAIPDSPGAYLVLDLDEIVWIGMADGSGQAGLRDRLREHGNGEIVHMFAQCLFLARAQFRSEARILHPRVANEVCRAYISERCSFMFAATSDAEDARDLEQRLKLELRPPLHT